MIDISAGCDSSADKINFLKLFSKKVLTSGDTSCIIP